jgi:hypothetical protein
LFGGVLGGLVLLDILDLVGFGELDYSDYLVLLVLCGLGSGYSEPGPRSRGGCRWVDLVDLGPIPEPYHGGFAAS